MIKYRGNFLYPGTKFEKNDISHLFYYFSMFNDALISLANKYEDVETYFETIDYEEDDFISSLEKIIQSIKSIYGVARTNTTIVLSSLKNEYTILNEKGDYL